MAKDVLAGLSQVINSDETSARVVGRTQWQWVFQTPAASYHVIAASRGGEVIDAFLAGPEPEVRGSGPWAPQVLIPAGEHRLCLSHRSAIVAWATMPTVVAPSRPPDLVAPIKTGGSRG